MALQIQYTMRELHSRTNDGIDVRLLWSESDGRVVVNVDDKRSGQSFGIEVLEGERAMDVFDHPYAYEPARRIEVSAAPSAGACTQAGTA